MSKLTDIVVNKIEALAAESLELDYTLEESQAAAERSMQFCYRAIAKEKLTESEISDWLDLGDIARKSAIHAEIQMLEKTLDLDLVEVDPRAKYVITDGDLISPAGFHPNELVFIKTNIFIQTEKLPRSLSSNLSAYDVAKLAA